MLRTNRSVEKKIQTIEGELIISRYVLRPKTNADKEKLKEMDGVTCIYPLDAALGINILPFKMTPQLMLKIARTAIQVPSYERTESILNNICNVEISDDTIRSVTNYLGALVVNDDSEKADAAKNIYESGKLDFTNGKEGVLYMSVDGATVNTRKADDNGSTWRENKLAMAYNSNDITEYKNYEGELCHRINKRKYAAYIGGANEFKWRWLALALEAGYGQYKETVILSDGAPWIRNIQKELFSDAQRILDLFHLKENVGDYFKALFPKDSQKEERTEHTDKICEKLENGEWENVLEDLKQYKRRRIPSNVVNLPKYIEDNKDAIDYPTYKNNGYVVGSGAIESSNKTVLQSRMKQAGMRWSLEQGQGIVALKARQESDMWESVERLLYKELGLLN